MANFCEYAMKVVGTKENVTQFGNIIQADYSYANDNSYCSAPKHFWRVFEASVSIDSDDELATAMIDGYCAWSVATCFFPDGYEKNFNGKYSTDILTVSKELNLLIEIKSLEPGCEFMEHFIINNGILELDLCKDFSETDYYDENGEVYPHKELEYMNLLTID